VTEQLVREGGLSVDTKHPSNDEPLLFTSEAASAASPSLRRAALKDASLLQQSVDKLPEELKSGYAVKQWQKAGLGIIVANRARIDLLDSRKARD
jgi:hypothetical protein